MSKKCSERNDRKSTNGEITINRNAIRNGLRGHHRSNNLFIRWTQVHTNFDWHASKTTEIDEKRKIRAITPFKVIDVGIDRKPVCDFLLVINSNWYPISYRFRVIAAYCSNFGHFTFMRPFGGLETTYDVHLGLIGKRIVNFLLVLIKLFSPAKALWAKRDGIIGDFAPTRSVWPKISYRRRRFPPIIFAWIVKPIECLTILSLAVFTRRNFVADFLQAKCDFRGKMVVLRFTATFGGFRGNVWWSF